MIMRNIKYVFAALLCLSGIAGTMAQVDVTAIYLKNAGFDTSYDYPIDAIGNVAQEMLDVDGWTNDYSVAYTIVGTYQIGTKKTFNGASVPATNVDGTSEGGVLALSTGWNESIKLYQEVTLPKGDYSLVTAYYNGSSATAATSLVGWVPSSGTGVMSEVKNFPANQWVVDTLS
jgi:co-chaperonin GroES (HSP10)